MRDNEALIAGVRQGDKNAKTKMAEENMGLVHSVVKRFSGRGFEREDLVQIGAIGLIKAIDKFDPSFDVRFSTYAVPMIIGEIKRFMRDDGMIKVSRSLKEAAVKGCRAKEALQKRLGREPGIAEISEACGIGADILLEAFEASAPPNSIYESVYSQGGREVCIMDTIADKGGEDEIINRVLIDRLLLGLSERERRIIKMRYMNGKTQAETAKKIGVSQVQISRLEKKALQKLRSGYGERD